MTSCTIERLPPQGNHNEESINQRITGMEEKLVDLDKAAATRKSQLNDNSAFLQFMWKTDVVDSWIGESNTLITFH